MRELYDHLIKILVEKGKGAEYSNKDVIEFPPGTFKEINETLIRIDERKRILKMYGIKDNIQ